MIAKIVLLCLIQGSLFAGHFLSICAIFKNEASWLKEWIEFHKLQGVEHFFLYNNNSDDHYEEVLRPYIASQEVTLIDWPLKYKSGKTRFDAVVQIPAYKDCLKKYGKKTEWLAFIDLDEFLFCPSGERLSSFLTRYKMHGGLCVNWLLFGTSDVETIPPDLLLIELLTQCCAKDEPRCRTIKSVIQPRFVTTCLTPHTFQYLSPYFAVNAHHQPVLLPKQWCEEVNYGKEVIHDLIRINHYWTGAKDTFLKRKMNTRISRHPYEPENNHSKRAASYNTIKDTAILQFMPTLREKVLE